MILALNPSQVFTVRSQKSDPEPISVLYLLMRLLAALAASSSFWAWSSDSCFSTETLASVSALVFFSSIALVCLSLCLVLLRHRILKRNKNSLWIEPVPPQVESLIFNTGKLVTRRRILKRCIVMTRIFHSGKMCYSNCVNIMCWDSSLCWWLQY